MGDIRAYIMTGFISAAATLSLYKMFMESQDSLLRRLSRRDGDAAQAAVAAAKKHRSVRGRGGGPVRVWVDGCFDLMHFGHANAFRQARALGDVLVVGVNPDNEIVKYKGPPIMNDAERIKAVGACKWVDQVVSDVPYVMNEEYLQMIFDKYQIDYVVHGDDPCLTPEGKDVFETAKKAGRFRTIKRTEGVSTTDIVGRMLLMTRDHFREVDEDDVDRFSECSEGPDNNPAAATRVSQFLPTTRRITQFSTGKTPAEGDKIVYIDGAWDLFHAGHVCALEAAKKLGDFLLVGVHTDSYVNAHRGKNYPIMNLHERVLGVLSCSHVDEVIIGAPWSVTRDMIVSMNISVVVSGDNLSENVLTPDDVDKYEVPKEMGIFVDLPVDPQFEYLTTSEIVGRVLARKVEFEAKYEKKAAKEEQYLAEKEFVPEL